MCRGDGVSANEGRGGGLLMKQRHGVDSNYFTAVKTVVANAPAHDRYPER